MTKLKKSKIIFHSEGGEGKGGVCGGEFLVYHQVSFMKDLDCWTVFSDSSQQLQNKKLGWSYLSFVDPYTYPTENDSMGIMSGLQKPHF